jgi:hypothetical protein
MRPRTMRVAPSACLCRAICTCLRCDASSKGMVQHVWFQSPSRSTLHTDNDHEDSDQNDDEGGAAEKFLRRVSHNHLQPSDDVDTPLSRDPLSPNFSHPPAVLSWSLQTPTTTGSATCGRRPTLVRAPRRQSGTRPRRRSGRVRQTSWTRHTVSTTSSATTTCTPTMRGPPGRCSSGSSSSSGYRGNARRAPGCGSVPPRVSSLLMVTTLGEARESPRTVRRIDPTNNPKDHMDTKKNHRAMQYKNRTGVFPRGMKKSPSPSA